MHPEGNTLKIHTHTGQLMGQDYVPSFMDGTQDKSNFQEKGLTVSEHFTSLVYGFQLDKHYSHEKTNANIMEVAYNNRLRQYVILDTRGIVSWTPDWIDSKVKRVLLYPKYQHRVITKLQYVKKYNCYFILDKEFVVKVLNKDFEEVYIMNSGTTGASFMVFNSVTDELFTGGIGGIKVWQYRRMFSQMFKEIKPLSGYELILKKTLSNVGGSWVQRIEVNTTTQHLYCCSEMDVHVYNMSGDLLYCIERAHTKAITGCCFSSQAKVIITASHDTTVKVWSPNGGLLHVFHEHTRPVSNLQLHPENSLMFITSSHDGTIRIWSLETMDCLYCALVSGNNNPMWMVFTDENQLVTCTAEEISVWFLNYFVNFWGLMRSGVSHMSLQYGGAPKTTRLLAVGDDGSIRLFSQGSHKKLCTILPPPCLSPLEELPGFCYSRDLNLVYLLLSTDLIWIYTSRSDPACRLAVWDIKKIQSDNFAFTKQCSSVGNNGIFHTPAADPFTEETSQCISIGFLSSPVETSSKSSTDPINSDYFLLWGLKDGRILFMDPIKKGYKHMELKASKGPIMELYHDKEHSSLVVQSQQSEHTLIQIWSLPSLILQFSVTSGRNLTAWTRLENTLLTGHDDGLLTWYLLAPAKDFDLLKFKGKFPEHNFGEKYCNVFGHKQAVIALDTCINKKIFCSGSCNGNIKIWDIAGTILQELILNVPLGCICFLNNKADLLIAFKNHIFYVPHPKVCPFMEQINLEDSSSTEDSDIYEDFFMNEAKEQDIDSYLVPYDITSSKHFSEDNFPELQIKEFEEQEKDQDSFKSHNIYGAPTEIYLSPREQYIWSWPSISSLTDGDLELFSPNVRLEFPLFADSPTELNSQSPSEELSFTYSNTDKSDDIAISTCTQSIDEKEGNIIMPSIDITVENVCKIKDDSDGERAHSSVSSDMPIVPAKFPLENVQIDVSSHTENVQIDASSHTENVQIDVSSHTENVQIDVSSHTDYSNVTEQPETSLTPVPTGNPSSTAEDVKLTEKAGRQLEDIRASFGIGDANFVGKKTKKITKNENWKFLKQKKGSNKAALHVKKSEEKQGVVNISEIKLIENYCQPVHKSTSAIGKKLDQNLSSKLYRTGRVQSNSAIGKQIGIENYCQPVRKSSSAIGKKLDQNLSTKLYRTGRVQSNSAIGKQIGHKDQKFKQFSSDNNLNSQGKFNKTLIKSNTEQNVDVSRKPKMGAGPKDQEDDPDKQSADFYPFTAPSFGHRYSEDLKTEYEMRLADFSKRFSCNSDKTPCQALFESGKTIEFGKDWVERHIERYILLLMQQKLRAQSAKEKQTKSSSEKECKEKIAYPLFNSALLPFPEQANQELSPKIGLMSQSNHTSRHLKKTLTNKKHLKQKAVNPLKLLSQTPNGQYFFDIKNIVDIDKFWTNVENKKQRGWSASLFKKQHSAQNSNSSSRSSSVNSTKNQQNTVDTATQQNYKTSNSVFKFRFTLRTNKKTSRSEPSNKFPKLPASIWTSLHPRPLVQTKSIPTNDRNYEIMEKFEKPAVPLYLKPTCLEKKLLHVRFPVKKQQCCKLLNIQNLVFEPESTAGVNKD